VHVEETVRTRFAATWSATLWLVEAVVEEFAHTFARAVILEELERITGGDSGRDGSYIHAQRVAKGARAWKALSAAALGVEGGADGADGAAAEAGSITVGSQGQLVVQGQGAPQHIEHEPYEIPTISQVIFRFGTVRTEVITSV
jgi:hypothetical protein